MRITLEQACELLNHGDVVAVPTETVYGLAASLTKAEAIAQVFSLKGRPSNNPLIIHIADAEQLLPFVKQVPDHFYELAEAFWPGPMTLVVAIIEEAIPEAVRAGLQTAAFRMPAHPLARELIRRTGPLVMPSANLSGKPSATSPEHVEADFGGDFPVLDGGQCHRGVESTILFFDGGRWKVIRLGALEPEAFVSILGYFPEVDRTVASGDKQPLCPGQLHRHYAPKAKLHFDFPIAGAVVVGFEDRTYPVGCRVLSLGSSADPVVAAQRLYAILRQLDEENIVEAWVDVNIPDEGLWVTLKERLYRAGGM